MEHIRTAPSAVDLALFADLFDAHAADIVIRRIEVAVPEEGKVDILQFTDRQYENIICFRGRTRESSREKPAQLLLF